MPPKVIVQIITYRTEGIEAELDELFDSLAKAKSPEGGWVLAIIDQPSVLGNLREYLESKVKPRSGIDLPEVVLGGILATRCGLENRGGIHTPCHTPTPS